MSLGIISCRLGALAEWVSTGVALEFLFVVRAMFGTCLVFDIISLFDNFLAI